MPDFIALKWGSLKGWQFESDACREAARKYAETGIPAYAMHRNTGEQRVLLCQLIDAVDAAGGEIWNEWNDEAMTAEDAKKYVMEYGNDRPTGA